MQLDDGLGRSILITLLAAALFGAFLLIAPRLTASTTEPSTATTPAAVPTTVSTAPLGVTPTTLPSATTIPQPRISPNGPEGWDPEAMTRANGYDGTVALAAEALPRGGAAGDELHDREPVTWRLQVRNTTDGELWGVFAWVEGFGRALCDDHHLDPGAVTECRATNTAYAGTQQVVAWVNAWTEISQVKDKLLFELVVGL